MLGIASAGKPPSKNTRSYSKIMIVAERNNFDENVI